MFTCSLRNCGEYFENLYTVFCILYYMYKEGIKLFWSIIAYGWCCLFITAGNKISKFTQEMGLYKTKLKTL